jgi:hypothetical protein
MFTSAWDQIPQLQHPMYSAIQNNSTEDIARHQRHPSSIQPKAQLPHLKGETQEQMEI